MKMGMVGERSVMQREMEQKSVMKKLVQKNVWMQQANEKQRQIGWQDADNSLFIKYN